VYSWDSQEWNYILDYTHRFVYDGWNLIAVLDENNAPVLSFAWGTDLSGAMQGAGGVGGLLSVTVHSGANAGTYFYCYDGNGNVVALVSAADGTIAARYEYGPFGELLRATGPMAKANPFLFSTKYYDWETGLYYYGYRYYDPSTGRWLSRDTLTELGFNTHKSSPSRKAKFSKRQGPLADSYLFVRNSPVARWDYLGLEDVSPNLPCPASEDGMAWSGKAGFGGMMRCLYEQCSYGTTTYTSEGTYGDWFVTDEHWEEDLGCLQTKCRTYTEALYAVTGCGCRSRIVWYQWTSPGPLGQRVRQEDSGTGSVQKTLVGGPWSGTSCSEDLVDKTQEECGVN
jgi:RHS repeat-associated protein